MGLLLLMGDSGFRGALDALGTTGMESAWSVGRRMRSGYARLDPIIRVRRSSDNAEQDFAGLGSQGEVSTAEVVAFCGAGNGFLTTIYGQSGLSRHFTQSTTTSQPQVVASGVAVTENNRLAAAWVGTATPRAMSVAASTAIYKFLHDGTASTAYSVQRVADDIAAVKYLFGTLNVGTDVGFRASFNASEQLELRVQGTSPDVPVTVTKSGTCSFNTISYLIDADNATAADREEIWRDGSVVGTNNANTAAVSSANSNRVLTLGANSSNGQNFNGNFCELVLWSQDRSASRSIWEAAAKQFWGTP